MKRQQQQDAQEAYEEQTEQIEQTISDIEHIILVISGKGGVGKSTVAANIAFALASEGKRVGLMDADLHGPTIPLLTGATDRHATGTAESMEPVELDDGLGVTSIGFMTEDPDTPTIWRGPLRGNVLRQFIADVNWGRRDYLVIDLPPGTGDEPLTLAQSFSHADGVIVVTTPQEASLADCRKAINFSRKVELPVIGVIENMSGFVCPNCGEKTDIFSTGGGSKMAGNMEVPFLGTIPLAEEIVALCDEGKSLMGDESPEAVKESLLSIVDRLETQLEDGAKG